MAVSYWVKSVKNLTHFFPVLFFKSDAEAGRKLPLPLHCKDVLVIIIVFIVVVAGLPFPLES